MTLDLRVPSVGESITEVYIGEWHVEPGQFVRRDEAIVELESDKATFQLPAPESGHVTSILKQTGDTAEIGELLGHFEASEAPESVEKSDSRAEQPAGAEPPQQASEGAKIMPAAKRMLAEGNVRPEAVQPTGPGGRMLKEDVQRHMASSDGSATSNVAASFRSEKAVRMSPMRQRIAERLVEAQTNAALLTTFNEVDMSAVMQLRRDYQESFQSKYEVKLGFMSFFVKAVIHGLNSIPQINAEIRDDHIVYRNYFDIGIAIGAGKGLVVPVLRNAELMSFAEIEIKINELAARAKKNQITLDELQGGTFTITNGGVFGSLLSTPIINPPQSGVLGMHTIQERPVGRNGEIVLRPMMYVALTYDHRIVDGREAVTFLKRVKDVLEDPARLLLEV